METFERINQLLKINKLSKKDDEKLAYSKDVLELITNIESNEFKPLSLNKILTNNIELSNDKDIEMEEYESDSYGNRPGHGHWPDRRDYSGGCLHCQPSTCANNGA